jgi:hypothetical protein
MCFLSFFLFELPWAQQQRATMFTKKPLGGAHPCGLAAPISIQRGGGPRGAGPRVCVFTASGLALLLLWWERSCALLCLLLCWWIVLMFCFTVWFARMGSRPGLCQADLLLLLFLKGEHTSSWLAGSQEVRGLVLVPYAGFCLPGNGPSDLGCGCLCLPSF